jgi:hypothetical protein
MKLIEATKRLWAHIKEERISNGLPKGTRGNNETMGRELFISYSHKDLAFVRQLGVYLAQEEIPPWVDNQLEYGESWQEVIVERIRRCVVFLVVMSPNSHGSSFVDEEIALAMKEGKTIIPILINGEAFDRVEHLQLVDMRNPTWPNYRFVERLRDLTTPGRVPSHGVQRRRVELFVCMTLRSMMEIGTPITTFGVGYGADYGIDQTKSVKELGFDDLDWVEFMLLLNEQLPGKNFELSIQDYHSSRFPQITTLVDYLLSKMDWKETRRIDVTWG